MKSFKDIISHGIGRQPIQEAPIGDRAAVLLDKAEGVADKIDSFYTSVKNAGSDFAGIARLVNDVSNQFDSVTEGLDDMANTEESVKEASTAGAKDMQKAIDMMDTAMDLFLKGAKASGFVGQKKLQDAYTQYKIARNDLSMYAEY